MVMGCLTLGPLTGDQLRTMLAGQSSPAIARALKSLADRERVVFLDSGRWALIHRT
jgi:hypothetical protein